MPEIEEVRVEHAYFFEDAVPDGVVLALCVEVGMNSHITEGNVYRVIHYNPHIMKPRGGGVQVINDRGQTMYYAHKRFAFKGELECLR